MFVYAFSLVKVHDGDTVHVDVDCGFHVHYRTKIRFLGINCPELATPAGKVARDYTAAWFAATTTPLTVAVAGPDKYGDRWDGTITRGGDPVSLNAALLASGNAAKSP